MNRVTEILKNYQKEELIEEEERIVYTLEDKDEFSVKKKEKNILLKE